MSTSTAADTSTRARVLERDGHACWVCRTANAPLIQIVHLIPLSRTMLLYQYHSQGLVPPTCNEISCDGNLIPLCSNCHILFDVLLPQFVIVPTDLNFFIAWETKDYQDRSDAADAGEHVERTVPGADDYKETFRVYHFGDSADMPDRSFEEKRWGGAPTAMILKACMGALQPVLGNGSADTLPAEVRTRMSELLNLYSRPDPVSARAAASDVSGGEDKGDGEDEDGDEDEAPPTKRRQGRAKEKERRVGKGTRGGKGRQPNVQTRAMVGTGTVKPQEPLEPPNPRSDRPVPERICGVTPWAFGPDKTTREIAHAVWPGKAAI